MPGGFAEDMRRFLPVARKSPTNYVLVSALVIAPALALVGLWDQPTSAPFVLTALGLAATLAGPLLTSRFLAEPNYAVILAWDPRSVPSDWRVVRARYFPAELGPRLADVAGVRALRRGDVALPAVITTRRRAHGQAGPSAVAAHAVVVAVQPVLVRAQDTDGAAHVRRAVARAALAVDVLGDRHATAVVRVTQPGAQAQEQETGQGRGRGPGGSGWSGPGGGSERARP